MLPKYTDINGLNKLKGRGWSRDGMIRFIVLQKKVEGIQSDNTYIVQALANYLKLTYKKSMEKQNNLDETLLEHTSIVYGEKS